MVTIFRTFPLLRGTAPRLSGEFFSCRRCLHQPTHFPGPVTRAVRNTPFLQAFRSGGRRQASVEASISRPAGTASPLRKLSETISHDPRQDFFPKTSSKVVGYWLLGSAASVFGIVIFGGLTRLTESGLSITEWRPVTGSMPPRNEEDWESEFTKYRSSPEYKQLNPHMTLDEFKKIYFMEWTHRLWGRVVGITFLLPTIYFVLTRRVSKPMAVRITGINFLIAFQGFLGWWMVKSGLKDDLFAPGAHPRVSQYRLAAHLGTAFLAYVFMLSSGLRILQTQRLLSNTDKGLKMLSALSHPFLRSVRSSTLILFCLVFTTAMSGALVAGLDAGLIYNDFPWMGQGLTPPKKELFDPFYSHTPDNSDLWWRNMLENPSLVQLDHRILAMTTFTAICALSAYSRFSPKAKSVLSRAAAPRGTAGGNIRKGITGLFHLAWMQVALGISTLWYLVPTHLAATHQAGALALLTMTVVLGTRVHLPKRTIRLLMDKAASQGKMKPRAVDVKPHAAGGLEQQVKTPV